VAAGRSVARLDEALAVRGARFRRRSSWGSPRPANDSWGAACCLVNDLPPATFNTKDFADFAQHDGLVFLDIS